MSLLRILAFLVLHNISMISAAASKCKLDLGLVVDTTKSIQKGNPNNINYLKESLKLLIQAQDVSESGTHVSLETFAANSVLHNKFNEGSFHSNKAMEDLVEKSIGNLTMPTRLDYAIFKADEEMFTEGNGDRAGVRSVMVLFSDGKSHPNTTNFMGAVDSLMKKGIRIVVVAIGKFANVLEYRNVLRNIAGDNIFYVADYQTLQSVTDDIQTLICPPSPCENSAGMDVVFLVDRTGSIGRENFKLLKGFLLEIIDALDISPHATHVALILFAKQAKILNTLSESGYHTNKALHNLIKSIPNKLGKRTFIDRALEKANRELFTVKGGDRPKFPNVLILLTDGKTNKASKPYGKIIRDLKAKNVRIVAVGIGKKFPHFREDLKTIAGDNLHDSTTFRGLPDLFSAILNETCSADGQFSRWSFWSDCSVTCGGDGVQTKTRTCTNPPPQGYGKDCIGDHQETRACGGGPCPAVETVNDVKLPEMTRSKSGFKRTATYYAK